MAPTVALNQYNNTDQAARIISFRSILRSDFPHFSEHRRSITKLSKLPEQARQERDPQKTPKQRSADGHDGVRDHVRHPNQSIMRGFWCPMGWHFRGAAGYSARSAPTVDCRTVCAKTR